MFFRCDTVGVTHAFDLFAPTLPLVHKLHTGRFYRATPRWPGACAARTPKLAAVRGVCSALFSPYQVVCNSRGRCRSRLVGCKL